MTVSLAIDMHGGDYGLDATAVALVGIAPILADSVTLHLCGDEVTLLSVLKNQRLDSFLESGRFVLHHAEPTCVGGRVSKVYRDAPNSSLVRALQLQADGLCNATLSAGDTGALYSSAFFLLGRQESIERPALGATFPTSAGEVVLILDIGANLECRASHLADFGRLGVSFLAPLLGRDVSVGLLNVGHESHKGPRPVREAHELLSASGLDYRGFIEGNRVLTGDVDVVVCDGFTGNALLKLSEGMFRFVKSHLGPELTEEGERRMQLFNSDLYGAVPILGMKGTVFKAHGRSTAPVIRNAVTTAVKTLFLMQQNENYR